MAQGALAATTQQDPLDYYFGDGDDTPSSAPAQTGALAATNATPSPSTPSSRGAPNPMISPLMGVFNEFTGPNDQGQTPLQQMDAIKAQRDAASAKKMSAINTAIARLQPAPDQVNLPLLAAMGKFLQPTRTGSFGESIGNAAEAAVPAIAQQRQVQRQNAVQEGQLGIEAAGIPLEQANMNEQDLMNRLKIGEGFGTAASTASYRDALAEQRERSADLAYQRAIQVAGIGAASRQGVADTRANTPDWQYLGNDPDNPKNGVYLNKRTLETTNTGPAVAGKNAAGAGADPARIREANALVKNNVAPDFSTAYSMVRAGVSDAGSWQREVESAKKTLISTPAGMQMAPEDLEANARAIVISRAQAQPAKVAQPIATPTQGSATPSPGATPAAAAAAAATAAAKLRPLAPDELAHARAVIQQGADPEAVKKTLQNRGIDPSGLDASR